MSSTNKTTNYDLSQFIGSDKPAWLGDYNSDMSKIDAGIHTAATTATGADGKADANTASIGTLTSLTTDVKTDLVSAINEVDSHADTAQGTANQAVSDAASANTAIGVIQNYFNLSVVTDIAVSDMTASSGTIVSSALKVVRNSAGTLAKIYGQISHNPAVSGPNTITVNVDTGLRPTSDIIISPSGTVYPDTVSVTYKIMTNGRIEISYYAPNTTPGKTLLLFPCLYFIQDFGD